MRALFATLAQLVEQRIRNARVGGSSPLSGSLAGYAGFFILSAFLSFLPS